MSCVNSTRLLPRSDSSVRGLRESTLWPLCFWHGYRHTAHESRLGALAREIGFAQVSVSHEVSPRMKLVSRGDTTVVDAYLSPILRRYVASVDGQLGKGGNGRAPDVHAVQWRAHRSSSLPRAKMPFFLARPEGVVGMVRTAEAAGFSRLIGFDMGGTSTDVSHYAGELERTHETEVAGVRVRAPMIHIHTVAAGGGSILHFDGSRLRVGPDSAGADPGPAAYGNGGPLTITDCNVVLRRLRPEYFPHVFGSSGSEPLDVATVQVGFEALTEEIERATGITQTVESVAEGFLSIAVENMANAIKKISVQRGYDVSAYTLVCFGGAGGQHACLVADRLGIERILIHPYAGVLSALGIGLADIRHVIEVAVEATLSPASLAELRPIWDRPRLRGHEGLDRAGCTNRSRRVGRPSRAQI